MSCEFGTFFFERYYSDVAVKGLLFAIKLSTIFRIILMCNNEKDLERFENVFPAMIAAAVGAGTKL